MTAESGEEDFWDTQRLARRLQCTPMRVRVMCDEGYFDGAFQLCPGGKWKIPAASVERFLDDVRGVVRR